MTHLSLLLLTLTAAPAADLPLSNPDFEDGLAGWEITQPREGLVQALPEAASIGQLGLRLTDDDPRAGLRVVSQAMPATPGRVYRLVGWGRQVSEQPVADLKLVYRDAAGKELAGLRSGRWWGGAPIRDRGRFERLVAQTIAPEGAVELRVVITTWGTGVGIADLDDLRLEDVTDAPEKTPVRPPAVIPPRATPAKVVLKLDDLVEHRGGVHPGWTRIIEFCKERRLKAGLGIIGNSLEGDKPAYVQYLKDLVATGLFELWNHGYDHKEWRDGERTLQEFKGSGYAHQKEHLTRTQQLVKEKVGVTMTVFGSPFNSLDEDTCKVLAEDPDLKVWLYGSAANPAGKTVLTRMGCVNLEATTFVPDAPSFIDGYAHNREREYFCCQGHPTHWNEERWANVVAIIEFLQARGDEFVFASELAGAPGPR